MKRLWDIYKTIRKPLPPQTKVERPLRGRGYKRPQNNQELYGEEL